MSVFGIICKHFNERMKSDMLTIFSFRINGPLLEAKFSIDWLLIRITAHHKWYKAGSIFGCVIEITLTWLMNSGPVVLPAPTVETE